MSRMDLFVVVNGNMSLVQTNHTMELFWKRMMEEIIGILNIGAAHN